MKIKLMKDKRFGGRIYIVEKAIRAHLQTLTHRTTLHPEDVVALESLGHEIEYVQPKTVSPLEQ